MRKADRALRSAEVALRDGDSDGAVNRTYYAVLNVTRAALLSAGIAEDALPRTHRGVIAAFSRHAVQTGRINQELARVLGRAEDLRLRADYTGEEIGDRTAGQTIAEAQAFINAVVQEYALSRPGLATGEAIDRGDGRVSEPEGPATPAEEIFPPSTWAAIEEEQRQARENWLNLRRQQIHELESAAGNEPGLPQRLTSHRQSDEQNPDDSMTR
jgi:uncharacterized protein (UPF0332 family)